MDEEWRQIHGYVGRYQVSNLGRVRSTIRRGEPKILVGGVHPKGYRIHALYDEDGSQRSHTVHMLVARAFLGPRPTNKQVRHLNGDAADNRLENLAYGTASENMRDRRWHGRDPEASKTHCAKGHPFDEINTERQSPAQPWRRRCRVCAREYMRKRAQRLREQGLTVRGTKRKISEAEAMAVPHQKGPQPNRFKPLAAPEPPPGCVVALPIAV